MVGDIDAGNSDTLIIIGGNPAYNTPSISGLISIVWIEESGSRSSQSLQQRNFRTFCHWTFLRRTIGIVGVTRARRRHVTM
jgi:hypothetical protein